MQTALLTSFMTWLIDPCNLVRPGRRQPDQPTGVTAGQD